MKIVLLLLLFIGTLQVSLAQNEVSGNVLGEQGNPLLGVNVYIKSAYDGASSDENGAFNFHTTEIGRHILIASFIGFKSAELEININGNLEQLQIILKEEINKIDGVTISAGAFEASDKKKSVILKTFDIVTTAGATADITGVMNTLPGTQTVGEEGKLFVRGGAGHEAKTFINGLLVDEPYGQTPQNIPSRFRFSPFLFKGAFFSTGGYSAEYGQALSSVLQLNTYDLPARSQTDISIMSVGADVSQTIRKNNTSLYGQLQYTDLTAHYALVPQKYDWERAPNSLNSTLHFKQKFNSGGNLQAYINYDKSGMKVYQPKPGNLSELVLIDMDNENFYSNVSVKNQLTDNVSYRGGMAFTSNRSKIILQDGLTINNQLKSIHTKMAFDQDLSENIILKYGGEWFYNSFSENISEHENSNIQSLKYDNHLISPFVETDIYFSNKFVARVGARYEYNDILDDHELSPRASLAYKSGKSSQISMAYGKFSQLPVSTYLKLSANLKPEKAAHYIINYQYSVDGRVFRAEAYYKKYDQLTTKSLNFISNFDLSNNGYGEAKGIELFWRDSKTFEYIDYWVSYTYLDTERKYDHFPYPVMPYYASNHNLSIVYKHFIPAIKSQIGWTYSFASGRPYTDPNVMDFNSEKTKNYNDLSLNYSYLLKPNMIIHASMSNVLGFENIFGYQYNSSPNEQGVYESIPIEPQAKRFLFLGFFITISKDKNANQLNNL